jgi:hypothetical protein
MATSRKRSTTTKVAKSHPYLRPGEKVRIIPVKAGNKWNGLLINADERKEQPHLFNDIKKVFSLPLSSRGGQIKQVLDDVHHNEVPEFPTPLTEQGFFEKILRIDDLGPYSSETWKRDRRFLLEIGTEGLTLDLGNPLDMIKYKVAQANPRYIASSQKEYEDLRLATYQFVIVSPELSQKKTTERIQRKAEQYSLFNSVSSDIEKARNMLILGRKQPSPNSTNDQIINLLSEMFESNAEHFVDMAKDPKFQVKVDIEKARLLKHLSKQKNIWYTDGGDRIGDYNDMLHWWEHEDNIHTVARFSENINNSKEFK